jgi:hypothetical protein
VVAQGRRAKKHGDQEKVMFRLASLIGVACLALAACALVRKPANLSEEDSSEQNPNPHRNLLSGQLVRVHGGHYHAQFSVN